MSKFWILILLQFKQRISGVKLAILHGDLLYCIQFSKNHKDIIPQDWILMLELYIYAGLLGSRLHCCHSIFCCGGDVNRHHHSFLLPGLRRAPRNSTICSSSSHWNSQRPKRDAKTYSMKHSQTSVYNFIIFQMLLPEYLTNLSKSYSVVFRFNFISISRSFSVFWWSFF